MAAFRAASSTWPTTMRVAADDNDGQAALRGPARHRLLCAHREGPYGVSGWNRQVEQQVGRAPRGDARTTSGTPAGRC